jgi:glycosyltransferase involved in cell wall biosynthesis
MKILYVCNDLAYFTAHRRWLAGLAREQGHLVWVACGACDEGAIQRGDVDVVLDVDRHRLNLRQDIALVHEIVRIAREFDVDVVHLITIKPILFGCIGLRLSGSHRQVVATFPGLGRLFDMQDMSWRARLRRSLVMAGLRFGLASRNMITLFETHADMRRLIGLGLVSPERAVHIAGAGVEKAVFQAEPLPPGPLKLLFAGRLLRAKGINVLVEAAACVAAAGHSITFLVAGAEQPNDPDAITRDEKSALLSSPHIRFLGEVAGADMPGLLASVHAVVLPTSYQEGIPRILIEAGAVGRCAVVANNPGCLAFVEHEQSGLVLDELTPQCLADAAIRLLTEAGLLQHLSAGASHRFATGGFSGAEVGRKTLALYGKRGSRDYSAA